MRAAMVMAAMVTAAMLTAGCGLEATAPAPPTFPQGAVVDLTHGFDEDAVYWPTAEGFELTVDFEGMTDNGYYYAANSFCSAEHGGTHLDAPVHFAEGRHSVEEIPLERLIGPGIVVDVRDRCRDTPDYQVGVADFERWEAEHGRLPDGAIVLLNTGRARLWPDRERYMGTAERGAAAVAKLHFPGLAPEAAAWLVEQRAIGAIGLDTPSIDYGQSKLFEAHRILFEANIPAFENLAALDRLPAEGFSVIALPMKIVGGSGGPLRIVAIVPA